eukprot:g20576.t2
MRVHVVENAEEAQEEPKAEADAPKAKERVPVPRFRSSWTGGTVLWSSEKTAPTGQVVWQWEHRTGFKAYDVRATARIEDAFQRGLSRVRLKFFHDMIQFDPKTGNTRKIRRVGRDSLWKRFRRKVNEWAWLIETGRTTRVVFAQYEQKRKELHSRMDRRDYHAVPFGFLFFPILVDFQVIRFAAFRRKRDSLKDFWFCFDSSLVVLMIGEVWVLPIAMFFAGLFGSEQTEIHNVKELTILRTVRLLRLTRLGRIARLLRAVPEVVTLLKGIAAAIRSVFFTLLLLLVLLFVFGVVFKTQAKEEPGLWRSAVRVGLTHTEGAHPALLLAKNETLAGGLGQLQDLLREMGAPHASMLLVTPSLARETFRSLREKPRPGCIVVLLGLPSEGLLHIHEEEPPTMIFGLGHENGKEILGVLALRRGCAEVMTLSLSQWEELRESSGQGSSLHGLALGQLGGCCCYFDGRIEALEVAAIRLCPEGSKLRWELFEPDGNAEKLPKGLAPFSSPMHAAADFISAGCALAFTGAGISKESGVPTYRDGDGLWKRYDAMEVSSLAGLAGEPAKVWAFEKEFSEILRGKGPNPGHLALAKLEEEGCIDMVVTQNVDGFHQAAGSRKVVELHGSEVHAICLNRACGKRLEMAQLFDGSKAFWSPEARGWGLRWPEGDSDTDLQKAVRSQLEELIQGKKDGKSQDSSSSSESTSSSSSSVSSGTRQKRRNAAKTPKPLTEQEKADGPPVGRVPICPSCQTGLLKPDGVYFGESLDKRVLKRALLQSINSKVVMMVGTRGEVDPAAKLPVIAKREQDAKIIEVNIGSTRLSKHADIVLRGAAGEVLPKLMKLLGSS